MKILAHLLYPGEHNNFHPHVTRVPFLFMSLIVLLIFTFVSNMFFSSRPKLLGFATNIYANEVVDLTNKQREKLGLKPLKENHLLDEIAREKAKDMFGKDYWAHTSPDGTMPWHFFQTQGYRYLYAGENLARDFYTSGAVVAAWMDSPSHRENLLNEKYQEIGVTVVNGRLGNQDTTLVVQMFGTPFDEKAYLAEEPLSSSPENFRVAVASGKTVRWLPLATLGVSQKVYLGFSLILLAFFLFDSYILIKTKVKHTQRHPFFHATILGVIAFLLIYLNRGLL